MYIIMNKKGTFFFADCTVNVNPSADELVVTKYELVPDRKEQIQKMNLSEKTIKKKHRYIYFLGNKSEIKKMKNNLLLEILPYPKGENNRYISDYNPIIQSKLF